MASIDEYKVRALLEEVRYLWANRETDQTYPEKARKMFDEADSLVRSNSRMLSQQLSLQMLVLVSETAMMLEDRIEAAERSLDLYFQYPSPLDQFYIRALLAYAQIQSLKVRVRTLKGQDAIDQTKLAYTFVQKAVETIVKPENKQKYVFLVYNTSVAVWNILRPMMLPGFAKSFTENLEKMSALLEEMDDIDVAWRVRYLQALANAYLDADRKVDAQKILDKVWDIMKRKGQVSYIETLWRMKVHVNKENAGIVGSLRKEAESVKSDLKFFVAVQQIRSGGIPDVQVEKEIQGLIQLKPGADGLAEIGRAALQYNLLGIAKMCLEGVETARQPSLRARVWHEYSKAEFLVKDSPEQIDRTTGMKFTPAQLKAKEAERRIEALKIVDRAMVANKRLNDAGVTTEGCILIWNIGKPLLTVQHREHVYKAFQTASSYLESLDSPMHELRIFIYMELAKYELEQGFIAKAESEIVKASLLDATNFKIVANANEHENPKQLQRPYEKTMYPISKRLDLKKNIYKEPERLFEQAWLDIENAKSMKNQAARETVLKKAADKIVRDVEPQEKLEDDLVEEEKQEKLKQKKYQAYRDLKLKYLISGDLAEIAYETSLYDLAAQMSEYSLSHEWDPLKEVDLVAMQANSHFILAKCKAQRIIAQGFEPGFALGVAYESQPLETVEPSPEDITDLKRQVLVHIKQGAKLGVSISQPWVCFNAGVTFWNIYLNVVRYPIFEKYIFPDAVDALRNLIDVMNTQIEKQVLAVQPGALVPFNKPTDFKYPKKLQIFSEIGIMFCKILYSASGFDEGVKICDLLLTKPIGPQYRKELERIKGACIAVKAPAQQKGGAAKAVESSTGEVFALMENARAIRKDPAKKALFLDCLKKANTLLQGWNPNETDESELILHSELWCKLGRQTFEAAELNKLALLCAQRALTFKDKGFPKQRRLSWYSVAEFLYGDVLIQLIDEKKQEKESQNALRAAALEHFVKAGELGMHANIAKLVLDAGRAIFNASLKISGSQMLISPMAVMAAMLVRLKDDSDPDFLLLFYRTLIESLTNASQWERGEKILEDAFLIVPMSHQKWLWEAQIVFLSKQGKNVLNYLLRMKESNPLLQAKIWVKLARSSVDPKEIDNSYKKATEILEGNIECSDVLIEWSTWLHLRGEDVVGKLKLAAEIIEEVEKEGDENKSHSSFTSKHSGRSSNKSSSKRSAASKSNVSKTKSKITSREEVDGNPEKLNVTHFDRLIRIYMMLGELAPNANRRKQYCLNAFSYILRTLESTLGTFSKEKQDWTEFKLTDETIAELEKAEDREKLCKFAFDKPNVSHTYLKQLAEWLDEVFLQQWECLLVLEYLKIFSRLVLKSPAYEWIYSSWKCRLYKKLGIDRDLPAVITKFAAEEAKDLGAELFKRDEIIEAEKLLQQGGNLGTLATISFMQGRMKACLKQQQQFFETKSAESLSTLPDLCTHLLATGKFQEAYSMLQASISRLVTHKSNNTLTFTWILVSAHLALAYICAVQCNFPVVTADEKTRYKAQTVEGLKFFLQTAKMKGCCAGHIYQYLQLHDFMIKKIESRLVSRINREVMNRRIEKLGKLRNLLTVCSSLCVDLLDIDNVGEGQALSGIIDWRIGEVTVLVETMRKELVKRSSYDNVITKYLDEMELLILEETRNKSKSDSVAEILDEGIESALKYFEAALSKVRPAAPVYPLIQISNAVAKFINGEEFQQPEQLFSLKFPQALHKYHLLHLQARPEGSEAFMNLAYLQYSRAREHFLELFLRKGKAWLKDRLLMSLIYPQSVQLSLYPSLSFDGNLAGSNVWKNLNWKPTFEEMKDRIQPNSAVLILQYSVDIVDAWAGLLMVDKDRNTRYWFNTKQISTEEQVLIQGLLEKFRVFKNFTLKNPIADEEEQEKHWAEADRKVEEIVGIVREIGGWMEGILELLNPEAPLEVFEDHPKKKAQPVAKNKGDEKVMDTGLPLPSSGVGTLYLCIDSRFIELPWESLPFISIVPIIIRDFSMVNLDYRQAHTANFTKDTLKYIIEKPTEPKSAELSDKLALELNTAKFEGNRVTSSGQWEKLCSQSSLLINFQSGGVDLQSCSSLSSSPCCKGIIALDSFNTLKKYMKKAHSGEAGINEMMTMLGCNTIIHNAWSISPAHALEIINAIWKSLATGQTIGGSLYKCKQTLRPSYFYSIQHYGLPYTRLS